MAGFQLLWLAAIWATGLPPNRAKLARLAVYTVLCALVVARLPDAWLQALRRQVTGTPTREVTVVTIAALAFGLSAAWCQAPLVPDESYHLAAAAVLADGGTEHFFSQYPYLSWLAHNHPPLVPLVHGCIVRILGHELMAIRLVSVVFEVGTALLTYRIGAALYDRETALLAALGWLSMPLVARAGGAGMTDMPVTFWFCLALWLVIRLARSPSALLAVSAGVAMGVGVLSKYTMGLFAPLLAALVIVDSSVRRSIVPLGFAVAVAVAVTIPWVTYLRHAGLLSGQAKAMAGHAVQISGTRGGGGWLVQAVLMRLPAAIGFYNLPALARGIRALLHAQARSDVLVLVWLAVVSLPLLAMLPDPRYFLPAFPALALAMARVHRDVVPAEERRVLLALLYGAGVLYVSADWSHVAKLFLR